jgi:hypothetical protein
MFTEVNESEMVVRDTFGDESGYLIDDNSDKNNEHIVNNEEIRITMSRGHCNTIPCLTIEHAVQKNGRWIDNTADFNLSFAQLKVLSNMIQTALEEFSD